MWLPMVRGDDVTAAVKAAARHPDPRFVHFWDDERALGEHVGRALRLPSRRAGMPYGVAWDVYMLFRPGARFRDLGSPALWMHQLDDVGQDRAPRLDPGALRAEVEISLGA